MKMFGASSVMYPPGSLFPETESRTVVQDQKDLILICRADYFLVRKEVLIKFQRPFKILDLDMDFKQTDSYLLC